MAAEARGELARRLADREAARRRLHTEAADRIRRKHQPNGGGR